MQYEQIYAKFRKPILEYVRLKVRNPDIAEEVTQEIFLKAYRYRDSYDAKFQFSTWLWTIARNTISDFFRKDKKTPQIQSDTGRVAFNIEHSPSEDLNPELTFIESDEKRVLLHRLSKLTELQKRVLLLKIINQFSNEEIARRLNLSLSAVKSLSHRAKCAIGIRLTPQLS